MNRSSRFGLIFWGLVLVMFDLTSNGFALLQDFIGYILVAVGCGALVEVSRHFSKARTLSWILAVLALLHAASSGDVPSPFGFVYLALDCVMIWFLLGGVMEFAAARGRSDLNHRASNRRLAYLVITCGVTLVGIAARDSADGAALMVIVVVVCVIPMLVLVLHLIHRVKRELASDVTV